MTSSQGWDVAWIQQAAASYQRDGRRTTKVVSGSSVGAEQDAVISEIRRRANAIAGSFGRKTTTREIGVRQRVCGAYERPRMRLASGNVRKIYQQR